MHKDTVTVRLADHHDLGPILTIQHEAFLRVARELQVDPSLLPPLSESHADLRALHATGTVFLVAVVGAEVIGSVRARESEGVVEFGRLVVKEPFLRRGVATRLMRVAEDRFPDADRLELFTGAHAQGARALYAGLGYSVSRTSIEGGVPLVWLEKNRTGL